jgi:ABC-type amino acid transport substrate-binding protein
LALTLQPGILKIASAFPDPPFDIVANGVATGFDLDLMRAVCERLSLSLQSMPYEGHDFNGIFDGLGSKQYDAVISGTTITPERERVALFSKPYLEFNQGVAVNVERTPHAQTTADLRGLTAGIQSGNTSDIVAKQLVAAGSIAGVEYYPYHGIIDMLADLEAGRIGLIIKLFPVISWLVKDRPKLAVAMQVPTHEKLGIAYAKSNVALRDEVDATLDKLRIEGEVAKIQARYSITGSA